MIAETSRATGSRFGGLQLHWLGEAGEKIASKPALRKLKLELKKLAGLVYVTDELLQDANVLEAFLRRAFASEFAFMVDDAIIRGLGGGQPLGILNSPALVTVAKETGQAAKTITAGNVLAMYSRLLASSVDTAVWLYNMDCFPQLCSMTIAAGTAGQPMFIPAGGLSGKPYNTLLGLPLIPLEQCSTLGQPGDLILMDPRRYVLATKGGVQTATSVHCRFVYDESVVRLAYRVDGMPELSAPVSPYQGSATQSAYIVLAERS
jgi:HK97 family phage major capsid protein